MTALPSAPARVAGPRAAKAALRILRTGLLVFCISFVFFGGVVSETIMAALPCQPHADARTGSCAAPAQWLANRIAPFLSAQTIGDYPFIFLLAFWELLLLWLAAMVWAQWRWKHPRTAAARRPRAVRPAASPAEVVRRMVQASYWLLLAGFTVFCLAFATPFLGAHVAREILLQLGCAPGTFDPFTTPCMSAPGFWTPRLQPFLIPILGQFLSPVWLVWKFYDVLIAWLGAIAALAAWRSYLARRTPGTGL